MKTLLIQTRKNPDVLKEEYESFLKYSGLRKEEMETFNSIYLKEFSPDFIANYHGIFIGGASQASALEPEVYPFISSLKKLVRFALEKNIPTFASCFGFQIAVLELGGQLVHQEKGFEMGTVPISLTPESSKDLLFSDSPHLFPAVSVHQQKAIEAPPGVTLLAETKECIHAFKVKNKNFWAFQFHPEVDRETLVSRLKIYEEKYTEGSQQYREVINNAVETPESHLLVKKFTTRVLKT